MNNLTNEQIDKISKLLGILISVTGIISAIITFLLNYPQWGIFIGVLTILVALSLVYRFKISKKSDVTEKTETKYFFSEKQRIFAGIGIIIILVVTNLIQFIPQTSQFIQSAYWPTSTPAITPTITPTFTLTTSPTLTAIPANVVTQQIMSPSATIVSLTFRTNDSPFSFVDLPIAASKGILVKGGDALAFGELWYSYTEDIKDATIYAEFVVNDVSVGTFDSVKLENGIHKLGAFKPNGVNQNNWTVPNDWHDIVIVLLIQKNQLELSRSKTKIHLSDAGDVGLERIKPSVTIVSLVYEVNGERRILDIRNHAMANIKASPNDKLDLREIWYYADSYGFNNDFINVQMYLVMDGNITDYPNGLISAPQPIEKFWHPVFFPGKEWIIEENVIRLSVRLIQSNPSIENPTDTILTNWIDVGISPNGGADLVPMP